VQQNSVVFCCGEWWDSPDTKKCGTDVGTIFSGGSFTNNRDVIWYDI
jgi:hypothetical protein